MKIEVWADFTCPFCYLGQQRLEIAMKQFGHLDSIHIEFNSFELDPTANSKGHESKINMLMQQYEMTHQEVKRMVGEVIRQGKELGLDMSFDHLIHTNTFHAHRLVKYATKYGKRHLMIESIFRNYFGANEDIGNRDVLLRIAEENGFTRDEIDAFLCLNQFTKAVHYDEQLAEELGIKEVPFFIFNEEYAVSGLQSIDVFISILQELRDNDAGKTQNVTTTTEKAYCCGNECDMEDVE